MFFGLINSGMSRAKQFELMPAYNFVIDFSDLSIDHPYGFTFAKGITDRMSELVYAYDSNTINGEVEEVIKNTLNLNHPKSIDIDDITFGFYLDETGFIDAIYHLWMGARKNFKTGSSYPRDYYERDIKIYFLDRRTDKKQFFEKTLSSTSQMIPRMIITLHRCFPQSREKLVFDYNKNEYIGTFNMNIKVNGGLTIEYGSDIFQGLSNGVMIGWRDHEGKISDENDMFSSDDSGFLV